MKKTIAVFVCKIKKMRCKLKTVGTYRPFVHEWLTRYLSTNNGICAKTMNCFFNGCFWIAKYILGKDFTWVGNFNSKSNNVLITHSLQSVVDKIVETEYPKIDLECTIVIPVYNGICHLQKLIPSLEENINKKASVIIIDDCSSDKATAKYVTEVSEKNGWKLLRNEENLGFIKTVNRAMNYVKTPYAILLNSDTVVPKGWLDRLLYPFENCKKVASTTPFTNSGALFSFPNNMQDNEIRFDLKDIDEAFSGIIAEDFRCNEISSATRFCMAINMDCWKEIGALDDENFGKGYGEENDWCFRALQAGWKHLIVPNLFVAHYHGGSFTLEEKKVLCEKHQEILNKKYPQIIEKDIPAFVRDDPWMKYRLAVALRLMKNSIVYIDIHIPKGDISGAVNYSDREMNRLVKQGNVVALLCDIATGDWVIHLPTISKEFYIRVDDVSDFFILWDVIEVDKVIINNIAYCEEAEKVVRILIGLKKLYDFELRYKFHDSFSICPSLFLINDKEQPCIPTEPSVCEECIINNSLYQCVKRNSNVIWRKNFTKLFGVTDKFEFFSEYSYELVKSVYPMVEGKSLITYHEPLLSPNASKYQMPSYEGKINIAFVGAFCNVKGSKYFAELMGIYKKRKIDAKFYVIGENCSDIDIKGCIATGRYERDNLGKILSEKKIHIVVYPSIANETFSYCAQELMLLNVPLVVFSCGAPQERIRKEDYTLGEITHDISAEGLFEATQKLIKRIYS